VAPPAQDGTWARPSAKGPRAKDRSGGGGGAAAAATTTTTKSES